MRLLEAIKRTWHVALEEVEHEAKLDRWFMKFSYPEKAKLEQLYKKNKGKDKK